MCKIKNGEKNIFKFIVVYLQVVSKIKNIASHWKYKIRYIPEFTIFVKKNAPVSHNQNFIQLHKLLNNII